MSEALLDVNVLIATVVENHVDHERARKFIGTLQRFYTTPTTQGGFLRFLTRPWKNERKEEQPPRMSMSAAFACLCELIESEKHLFLADDEPFTTVFMRSMTGHRQWTDAYPLRLSPAHGLPLATLDRKMNNMDELAFPAIMLVP
jgi:predicted nucleic acid-binding protein